MAARRAATASPAERTAVEDLELRLLLEAVFVQTGYDFRDYAMASLKRRIQERIRVEQVATISGLQERVLHDSACMARLLLGLSVSVSSMFRDPGFYLAFRTKVVPLLRTYPFIRVWHAGCSAGEEVYSMAILLAEERLYDRCRIYATDMNDDVLKRAADGIYPIGAMKQFTANYLEAGGSRSFSEYYTAMYDRVIIRPSLRENVVFAQHNLATDGPLNEFHVIVCRNVMIYFNRDLQARVHTLLSGSLVRLGFLGLGNKESLRSTPHEALYRLVDEQERLYRKMA